jgi:fused signal recognition particle receptor
MKFLETLAQTFAAKPIDWDELEAGLIRADLGVPITARILKRLQEREAWSLLGIKNVLAVAREEILAALPKSPAPIHSIAGRPSVILIVGVNGVGKTTSVAKLAHYLQGRGGSPEPPALGAQRPPAGDWGSTRESFRSQSPLPQDRRRVLLAAADTFRAAAIEQLEIWAKRLSIEIVRGQYGADPAALCYDAFQSAKQNEVDYLICDTAGRLHTKTNLMAELQKIKRSLSKLDSEAPHEVLLVVDATTGSNALSQAREFHQALGLAGLIVAKLDGSGKGGIVVAIQEELGIPTRFVGTGEKIDDFAPFDCATYIDNLL